jgi:hypothetical protein
VRASCRMHAHCNALTRVIWALRSRPVPRRRYRHRQARHRHRRRYRHRQARHRHRRRRRLRCVRKPDARTFCCVLTLTRASLPLRSRHRRRPAPARRRWR